MSTSQIYESEDRLIQKADPIFMRPGSKYGRAHFYAPYKQIGNLKIGTLLFNICAIWFMNLVTFIALYYNALKKFIAFLESLKLPILRRYGRELLQF
jgi:ABC transport system ATP-binding/permease protein